MLANRTVGSDLSKLIGRVPEGQALIAEIMEETLRVWT